MVDSLHIALLVLLTSSSRICQSASINESENTQSTATCCRCKPTSNLNSTDGDSSLRAANMPLACGYLLTLPRSRPRSRLPPVSSGVTIFLFKATIYKYLSSSPRDLPQQNSASFEEAQGGVCLKDAQPPFVSPSSETGTQSSNLDPTPEELESDDLRKTTVLIVAITASVIIVFSVTLDLMILRRRHPHREVYLDDRPTVSKYVSMDDRTARREPSREETEQEAETRDPPVVAMTCDSASTQAVRPEAQPELPHLLFLSDVIDDDPGAYMRSLHCNEIARIFRDAVTPVLQSHVTSGHLSEQASAELLQRHVSETRDLADDWMGRWQRGVSESLSLSDVWVTLLSMRKETLLQEVQRRVGGVDKAA